MSGEEVPRLAGLEGFEVWDRTVQAPDHKEVKVAFVAIRVGGTIGVNVACYKMWGEPEACQVMFDPERRRLALKPCARNLENSYSLSCNDRNITCRKLFDYYGVEVNQLRRYYDPKVIDGVLVVDL
jgi:hypothetical protein